MGRRYHRIALGGVRDEAEIRGHRRTYVGALPGRIIQGMKKVGVKNPVFVLDEVDKIGVDCWATRRPRSSRCSTRSRTRRSRTTTSTSRTTSRRSRSSPRRTTRTRSPSALWDRMEVIEVPGYTRAEKRHIATEFLCPKQLSAHGLTDERSSSRDGGDRAIIDSYTREAGVRGLEREIGAVCRHARCGSPRGRTDLTSVGRRRAVEKILGPPAHAGPRERTSVPGVATGLAWTPSGGDILFIEATKMPGKGEVMVTGNLKSVMRRARRRRCRSCAAARRSSGSIRSS
jgi:ATP-dependent Lon protease